MPKVRAIDINSAEYKGYQWLLSKGYKRIIWLANNGSPNFFADNEGFEVKQLKCGKVSHKSIEFTTGQVQSLNHIADNVTVLIFTKPDLEPQYIIPYRNLMDKQRYLDFKIYIISRGASGFRRYRHPIYSIDGFILTTGELISMVRCRSCKYTWEPKNQYELSPTCPKCGATNLEP